MSIHLTNTLESLKPIRLNEMDKVALMNRVDTKFIFHKDLLCSVLDNLSNHYTILEIDGNRISAYKNLYFDTEDHRFYNDHHNGKINRTKVRIREYANTGVCYVEVKKKNNKGRTAKMRRRISGFESTLPSECLNFIDTVVTDNLNPNSVLYNQFNRITLVNNTEKERVTFDFGITFKSDKDTMHYANLVIAEVKQEKLSRSTEVFKSLKSKRITPFRISKYCVGMTSLHENLKHNLFKEKIRKINKITGT